MAQTRVVWSKIAQLETKWCDSEHRSVELEAWHFGLTHGRVRYLAIGCHVQESNPLDVVSPVESCAGNAKKNSNAT